MPLRRILVSCAALVALGFTAAAAPDEEPLGKGPVTSSESIFVAPELKLGMVITAAAKNASVGKESLAAERSAVWRGVVAKYGSW